MSEPLAQLREFITTEIFMDPDYPLGDDDDLLRSGLVDSLGVMRIVYFIEEEYDRQVPFTDITIEHFNSLKTISDYVSAG